MSTETLLKKIMNKPLIHARWLNSLSYLEYRGFRKIVRSRSTEEMTFDVLMHAAEEVRHSVFFKKQAIRIGGDSFEKFNEETLLCSKALKSYFFEIDTKSTFAITGVDTDLLSNAAYSLVTWLVEKRAMSIYEVYEELLEKSSASFSLSGILKEESLHLKEVGESAEQFLVKNGFNTALISQIEELEFNKLWSIIGAHVRDSELNMKSEIVL
jgi:hypothetical protein